MAGINGAGALNVRLPAIPTGCSDPKAAERAVQNANDAAQHHIIDRRGEAAKPAQALTPLDRLLATPGPLDRFAGPDADR